ncbi:MAG: hypothetical protein ACJ8H8_24090 [Geminicoccaceae bacterium]
MEQTALAMTARLNQLFARWIAAAPEQWYRLRRRWPRPGTCKTKHTGSWPAGAPPTSAGRIQGPLSG